MGEFRFGVWRQALLGSLGLLSACGGQATSVNDGTGVGGTSSGTSGSGGVGGHTGTGGDAGTGGIGPGTTQGSSATVTGHVATAATTGSGGTQSTDLPHRAERAQCDPYHPSHESAIPPEYRGEGGAAGAKDSGAGAAGAPYVSLSLACEFDSDCTEGNHGDCYFYSHEYDQLYEGTACRYGCEVDADCAAGSVCECTGGNNRCVEANCATDADCEEGRLCLRTEYFNGCFDETYYACQTSRDECARNSDCPAAELENPGCGFSALDGHHACMPDNCEIGRPFLIYGTERRAETSRRSDWRSEVSLDPRDMTQAERRVLAARWEKIASMEHASIAAFARFALQLLSVGAPADLLERTHSAMADETRHARIAYGIGSRYAGHDLGPAPLSMDGALAENDFLSLVLNTVLEGCIGETVAAAEAAWGSEHAQDPALKDVFASIATDEARHAELAFAFVHWAIRRDPRLAPVVLETVKRELASLEAAAPNPADAWLARHGLLPDGRRSELKRQALEQMTLPCLTAICAVEQAA